VVNEGFFGGEEKRVELLTLGLGGAAALFVAVRWGWLATAGFVVGVLVSWINFRWLKQGVHALGRAATAQAGQETVRIPRRIYVRLIGRYVLLLVALCAILIGSWLPGGAVLAGLFAVVAAVLVDMIYRLYRGFRQGTS
jgi:hypothetical protein